MGELVLGAGGREGRFDAGFGGCGCEREEREEKKLLSWSLVVSVLDGADIDEDVRWSNAWWMLGWRSIYTLSI